jgi:hypothetical protein
LIGLQRRQDKGCPVGARPFSTLDKQEGQVVEEKLFYLFFLNAFFSFKPIQL